MKYIACFAWFGVLFVFVMYAWHPLIEAWSRYANETKAEEREIRILAYIESHPAEKLFLWAVQAAALVSGIVCAFGLLMLPLFVADSPRNADSTALELLGTFAIQAAILFAWALGSGIIYHAVLYYTGGMPEPMARPRDR